MIRNFIKVSLGYAVGWMVKNWRVLIAWLMRDSIQRTHYWPHHPSKTLWPVLTLRWRYLRYWNVGISLYALYGTVEFTLHLLFVSVGIKKNYAIPSWEKYHAE